jgi:alkanesulfonate monooxygenase SsuD/methylene tetrahydromethanopterin reductase-like flavin-dependent oxidoreductase (luciferase family)
MEVAARLADAWTWSGPFEERFKPLCEQRWCNCETIGRDPHEITVWSEHAVEFPQDPADFLQSSEEEYKLGPTPADAIAQLRPYVEFGISHFIMLVGDLPTLRRLCAEVLPAFE